MNSQGSSSGFTLVELVVVMLLAGILAAVALPRWRGDTGFEGRRLHDEAVAALRYAQKSAIAAGRTTCAHFDSAIQFSFRIASLRGAADCVAGSVLTGPDGQPLAVSATGSASFALPLLSDIVFDALGRPSGGAATFLVTDLPGEPIVVEQETGYVH